jgi:hypothetical protein
MSRYINPVPQYPDGAGNPVVNGQLFFFESEQNLAKSTFADQAETILNTNPVILDSSGSAPNIFYTGSARVVLQDSANVQVWERDPVGDQSSFADFGQWLSYITYDVNDIVELSNNFYISKTIGNQGNDPSVSSGSNVNWTQIDLLGLFNTSTTYSVGSIVFTSNGKLWASVVNSNLNHDPLTDADGDYWTSSVDVPAVKTTTGLIASNEVFASNVVINTSGYATAGIGAGSWKQNGVTGQTVSQSPAQLGLALLNDGNGDQWAMSLTNTESFDTFAQLEASTSGNVGQELICRARADAAYIIQPSGYVALDGDATLASGRVARLSTSSTIQAAWFGLSSSNSSSQNDAALTSVASRYLLENTRYLRYSIELPAGRFLYNAFNIGNAGTETGLLNGRVIVFGQGPLNTQLVCTAASGDALKVTSGRVLLEDFSVISDGVNRSASIGAGNGISIDATDGSTPAAVTVAKFEINNVEVSAQPSDGIELINVELLSMKGVTSESNGGYGYNINGTNYGGDVKGISNLALNCRALGNGNDGYRVTLVSECTFINCQSLENDGDFQFWSNGRGTKLINPDIEGKTGATNLVGVRLDGDSSTIDGGLVFGVQKGVVLAGTDQKVESVTFSNTGLGFNMTHCVDTALADNYYVSIASSDLTSRNVLAITTPIEVHDGGVQRIGGVVSNAANAPALNTFTISSSASTSFGDNYGGVLSSATFNVLLTSNAVITVPTTFTNNQEFEIIFRQDATGGRDVTFAGSPWDVLFSNAGNVADAVSSIKIKCVYDAHSAGYRFIQISATMGYI